MATRSGLRPRPDLAALEVGEPSLRGDALALASRRVRAEDGAPIVRRLPDPDAAAAGDPIPAWIDAAVPAAAEPEEASGEAPPPMARPVAPAEAAGAPSPEEDASAVPAPPGAELHGLSPAEAAARAEQGLVNAGVSRGRSDLEIIATNTFTVFNTVLFGLIGALLVVSLIEPDSPHLTDAGVVGIVVFANIIIGTLQELRATRILRKIVALAAPTATVVRGGAEAVIPATTIVQGDLVKLSAGDQVAADGPIVAGTAEIDESILTGETRSTPRSAGDVLLSGAFCTSGEAYYLADAVGADSHAVRETSEARQLRRDETPLQLRFHRLLRVLMIATASLALLLLIHSRIEGHEWGASIAAVIATVTSIVPDGLLLGFTVAFAVGALRVSRLGAIVQDNTAVEALNYVDTICLDKTGTLTANRLRVEDVRWAAGGRALRGWLGAYAVSAAAGNRTSAAIGTALASASNGAVEIESAPFNSERRWGAARLALPGEQRVIVLGEPERVLSSCADGEPLLDEYRRAAARGLRGVAFAEAPSLPDAGADELPAMRALALVAIADELRPEVGPAFQMMRDLGIKPKVISGDNPETVAALVQQLGVQFEGGLISGPELEDMTEEQLRDAAEANSVFGRIAPHQKEQLVDALRSRGHYVAMVGDGQNDVRALRRADVAVSMESGTNIARGVSDIVLRGDSFAALVRGSSVAATVLGNCSQLSKLFVAKSIYVFLIIAFTNMMGLEFPFLPRQGSLTALLTLGIPAAFITLTTPPPGSGRDFIGSTLRFAVPAAATLGFTAVAAHLLIDGILGRDVDEARTVVSAIIGIVGIVYMVQVIGFEGASRRQPMRPILVSFFGIALLGLFALVIYTPALSEIAKFYPLAWDEWAVVLVASLIAIAGNQFLARYGPRLIYWVSGRAEEVAASRGRTAAGV